MNAKAKGMTRVTAGLIIAVISSVASIIGSSLMASSQTEASLNVFKIETAKEIGAVKGNVQTLQSVNADINRRLENIEGSMQTLTSGVLQLINKQ